MSHALVRSSLLVVLIAALASPAFAFNLVTNPHFGGTLIPWSVAGNVTYDSANDATGLPGSGSAKSTFVAGGASTQLALSECIATGPGSYTLGGKVLIPNGQAVGGTGLITVSYFSNPGCTTGLLGSDFLSTGTTGSFQTLSGPITAPAGTVAIWITGQNNAAAAGTHIVNWDDFVLDNGQAPPIPVLGEWELLLLVVMIGAIGALALRRLIWDNATLATSRRRR